jgi:hypothetical protein
MKIYDSKAALFSMHIPKCGGTSLLGALRAWFGRSSIVEHYPGKGRPPLTSALVSGSMCVHGHFNLAIGTGIPQYYPKADQFITFLREPFERYLSLWFFVPKRARERGDIATSEGRRDFATALRRRAKRQRTKENFQSLMWYFPESPNVTDIAEQMDRSFVFVGVMERYQQSLDALAAALAKKPTKIPHLNDTPREHDYEEWRPFYRKHFADEYAVYEAALKRNDELLRRHL